VVTKGIAAGDRVVTDGQSRLQEGIRVATSDAPKQAANPPGSSGG
jgi:hypothetical protein